VPPAVSTLQTPTEYADQLLTLCAAAVADAVGGAIDRAYLSPGRPVIDCEQITVSLISLGDAPFATTSSVGGGKRHITGALNLLGFLITVARDCVPIVEDETLPDPDEINAAAVEVQEDVWSIWTRIRQEQRDGELFGGLCDHLFYDGARALETEGGFAGWEIEFRAEIAGILTSGS
jgi:hypothetical protein